MKLLRNIFLGLLVLIILLVGLGAVVYNSWTRGPLPQHSGTITVAGLQDTVEILRDEWGVPHIYASNPYDLFFAQGYTQAQDRWWQMEFSRHTGRGSIQELTGQSNAVMGTDIFIRKAGWQRAAEKDLETINPEIVAYLQAFSDGVNAYITSRPASALAFEYNILALPVSGVTIPIEPWTPVDTLVWTKVMSWDLSGNSGEEIQLAEMCAELDAQLLNSYLPAYPFGEKTTIIQPEDIGLDTASPTPSEIPLCAEAETADIDPLDPATAALSLRDSGIGSNSWVVNGEKSETGMPLLANDPHLGIGMPSIWYEIGLHCRPISEECPFDVVGFTFAPSPAVIIGHNANIAWGFTNVGWDTQDYYLIKVNPDNELQYEWNGEWRDMTLHEEIIRFGDSDETLILPVRETHLGPIMNDNFVQEDGTLSGFNNDNPRALRWTALQERSTLIEAVFKLNAAANWEDFRDAARLWDTPAQNMIYADIEGNIGYQTPSNVPIRAAGHSGLLPVDGSTDRYDWHGYVPFDNLPSVYNPERGFIATANQALVPFGYYETLKEALADQFGEDSHYIFSYYWDYGYRGQRIVDLLLATDKHNFDSFRAIHGDNYIGVAPEILPYFESLDMGSEERNSARDWLLEWDYQMHMDSPQAALFANVWARLMLILYEDQLGDLDTPSGNSTNMWATALLVQTPEHPWWDDANTDETESRDDILTRAFIEGYDATVARLGNNRDQWKWGDLHTATFISNPLGLSGISLIEDIVNRGPVPTSGGSSIVNATGWGNIVEGDFSLRSVPSMRMVVDLNDLSKSMTIHTTGQSGHPFSEHYNDMVDLWRNIEYKPMLWTDEQVREAAVSTLTLRPE